MQTLALSSTPGTYTCKHHETVTSLGLRDRDQEVYTQLRVRDVRHAARYEHSHTRSICVRRIDVRHIDVEVCIVLCSIRLYNLLPQGGKR